MHYTLTRSARKTTAIYIRDGQVEVRAPFYMTRRAIDRFVAEKVPWINKNVAEQTTQIEQKKAFSTDYGSTLTLRGKPYPITQRHNPYAEFDDDAFYMPPGLQPPQIKTLCIRLYKILAQMHITQRVDFFARKMKVEPIVTKINSATKRWGSCSSQKSLNFTWRLIMADDEAIDYVVVHELAHILQPDHSPQFWAIVQKFLPDYPNRQAKLKELQTCLNSEDWS
ncbi:MAG: M48 family metallopeptidase [Defluviitaleaceae bacterium]|nr:M48 family metallopeptidase [Defluviitaleaceae bacterium]